MGGAITFSATSPLSNRVLGAIHDRHPPDRDHLENPVFAERFAWPQNHRRAIPSVPMARSHVRWRGARGSYAISEELPVIELSSRASERTLTDQSSRL